MGQKFRLGLGNHLRNSTEHVLFATRGKAPVQFRSQPTWINAPVMEHNHKPEEQYAVIERISPDPTWVVRTATAAVDLRLVGLGQPDRLRRRHRLLPQCPTTLPQPNGQ